MCFFFFQDSFENNKLQVSESTSLGFQTPTRVRFGVMYGPPKNIPSKHREFISGGIPRED